MGVEKLRTLLKSRQNGPELSVKNGNGKLSYCHNRMNTCSANKKVLKHNKENLKGIVRNSKKG